MRVQELLRTSGFCPRLRSELQFFRGRTVDVVIVQDPNSLKQFQLNQFQYQVLRDMNGQRDLNALTTLARKRVADTNRDIVEELTVQAAGMGLLDNIPAPRATPMPKPKAPMLSVIKGGQSASASSEIPLDDDELDLGGDTTLDPNALLDPQRIEPPTPRPPRRSSMVDLAEARAALNDLDLDQSTSVENVTLMRDLPPDGAGHDRTYVHAAPPPAANVAPAIAPHAPHAPPPQAPPPAPAPAPAPAVEAERVSSPPAYEIVKPKWYRRKAQRRLIILGILAAMVGVMALIQYPLYITESCLMQPEKQALVRAPAEGILSAIMVNEGDVVKEGQVLAKFDDRKLSHELQRAKAEYDRLSANFDKTKSGSRPEEIRQARAVVAQKAQDVSFAKREVARVTKMYRSGDASQMERDERQRDYSVKVAALGAAHAQLKLVEAGFRSEEVTIAEAELRKAKADVEYYEKQVSMLTIKAPIAGKVLTPKFKERVNERVNAGDVVVEIGDATRLRVEILVPERDADVLAVGQAVTVKVHSFPLNPFHGKVTFIAPAVEEKEGQRYIRADAIVENPEGLLQPRMSGYAEIDAGEMSVLNRISRRLVRWVRVRFLI